MSEPKRLKRVVIKEEFVLITGHYIKAIILNQFLYWSERVKDADKFKEQENIIATRNGVDTDIELSYGWIYKTAKELSSEIMIGLSDSNIRKYIKELVEMGFISERKNPNPKYKFDKTLQYKVNIYNIQNALSEFDFVLDGYTYNANEARNSRFSKIENGDSDLENGCSKIEEQYQRLHTEITPEIINSKSSQSQTEPKKDMTLTIDNDHQPKQINEEIKKEPLKPLADQSTGLKSHFEISQIKYDYTTYKEMIQDNIEYNYFLENRPSDIKEVNELVSVMLDVICTKGDIVKINGEEKNRQMVISQYLKIDYMDIEHILDRFKGQHHKITHLHSYLRTMLYTIKQESNHYYTNQVRADGVVW